MFRGLYGNFKSAAQGLVQLLDVLISYTPDLHLVELAVMRNAIVPSSLLKRLFPGAGACYAGPIWLPVTLPQKVLDCLVTHSVLSPGRLEQVQRLSFTSCLAAAYVPTRYVQ